MKKLIISELLLLFLATTFMTDSLPPGWYQQTLPVNKLINDIFFIDSLKGWAVTTGGSSSTDTAYILNTTNGGANWLIQKTGIEQLDAIQFLDNYNGYAVGKLFTTIYLSIYKTTNSGVNWLGLNNISGIGPTDLYFTNKDTGWVSVSEVSTGGLYKTINGGINWSQQLSGSFRPTKLFFINKDTGWVACQNVNLYRTTNGGSVWTLQHSFAQTIGDIGFLNKNFGIVTSGVNQRTTDGGFTWANSENSVTGLKLNITSDSIAWAGLNFIYVVKTTTGGRNWFYQSSPINNNKTISALDSSVAWAGGSGIVHTTDGGGPPVGIIKSNTTVTGFKLNQNFPNPFNAVTLIFFDLPKDSRVDLKLYNILGEEVSELLDDEFFTAGVVQFGFNADEEDLSSGVYFYRLTARAEDKKEIFIDTRKMVLLK